MDYENEVLAVHGFRPDYGSGPHMLLMAATVSLARRDMSNPLYSAECRSLGDRDESKHLLGECAESFLTGNLVALFSECLGFEGSFLDDQSQ